MDHTSIEMPTHILRAYLLKFRLPMIKVNFDLALDEEIATLLNDPITVTIAHPYAKMD